MSDTVVGLIIGFALVTVGVILGYIMAKMER